MDSSMKKLTLEIYYTKSKGILLPVTVRDALENYFLAGQHKFQVKEIIISNKDHCPFCGARFEKDEATGLMHHNNSKKKCEIKSVMFTERRSKIRYAKVRG